MHPDAAKVCTSQLRFKPSDEDIFKTLSGSLWMETFWKRLFNRIRIKSREIRHKNLLCHVQQSPDISDELENFQRRKLCSSWAYTWEQSTRYQSFYQKYHLFCIRLIKVMENWFCMSIENEKVIISGWLTHAYTKTKYPFIEVLILCVVEYEMCCLLRGDGAWKDHHCWYLLSATLSRNEALKCNCPAFEVSSSKIKIKTS